VQALKALHLDHVVVQTPVLGLERDDLADVLEQARNCVGQWAAGVGHAPEHVGRWQAVALHGETEPHDEGGLVC
jgi:hypothetical protein